MYKELPLKITNIEFEEVLCYSKKIKYYCKQENHNNIYTSAGLSYIEHSDSPELDVIDELYNKSANLNVNNFILKNDIPNNIINVINKVSLGFKTSKIRFSCLFKGITIPWHVDYNCENITRVHLPVFTTDKCFYYYKNDNKRIIRGNLKFGKFYALDTNYEHCIKNDSNIDRVHLIINVNTSFKNYINNLNLE